MVAVEVQKLVNTIKMGYLARKVDVIVSRTSMNQKVLEILRELGVINGYSINGLVMGGRSFAVLLKYMSGRPVINSMRVVYNCVSFNELCNDRKYRHALIVSTSCGIITRSEAVALGVGGVVLIELC